MRRKGTAAEYFINQASQITTCWKGEGSAHKTTTNNQQLPIYLAIHLIYHYLSNM